MSEQLPDPDPQITGHPYEPATFRDAWPGICGHLVDGWPCGYSQAEHALEGATEEVPAEERWQADRVEDERAEQAERW